MHPYMNCKTCDPDIQKACTYTQTGICAKEAALPPAVCPMFDNIPIDECPGIDYHIMKSTAKTTPR